MLGFSPCGFVFSNWPFAARLKSCPDTIDSLKAILQEAHKINRIDAGFSPRGMLFAAFDPEQAFFRSLLSP